MRKRLISLVMCLAMLFSFAAVGTAGLLPSDSKVGKPIG